MSYIRYTQPRKYSAGESESYVYDSGGNFGIVTGGTVPHEDWVEILANIVGRLDLPESQKAQVIEAVVDYYLN